MGPPPKGGVDGTRARRSGQPPRRSSALKGAEPATTDRHEHFTQLARSLPFVVWTATPEGAVDYFNDAFIRYTGQDPESLLGDGWVSAVHPDDLSRLVPRWEHCVETGDPYELDFRIRRHDGEYRWHQVRAELELDDDGSPFRWWGTALDVHKIRTLEAEAAELARDREEVLESIGDGVCTIDREFRFTYLNRIAETLMGLAADEVLGKVVWEVIPQIKDTPAEAALLRVLETGEPDRIPNFATRLGHWYDIGINPSPDGLTVYIRDITEMKTLSDQLAIAHRLEAIGQLTGGIAHDFNNLLTVVMGAVESLSMEENLSPAGQEMIDLVSQAAIRGSELTHRLLAFARQQPLDPQAINVSQHVTSMIPLLKRTLGDEIEVNSTLRRGLPPALVDPGQFESALLNLAINARDAMPKGGLLELETGITELDEEYAAAHGDVQPGKYVIVSVGDTGTGIAPEHMPRLLDPFFTTKPAGQGSGLGLPMVWGFVKQSGGHVSIYSEVGRGTTIRLYLPLAPEDAPAEDPITVVRPLSQGNGIILLVEDDQLVRRFAYDHLSGHGYTVTAVGSGPEALEALDHLPHIDLLFTDVILPGGMTGRQVAAQVIALRPDTPVLYASGYTESVLMHDGRLDPDVSLLTKPYTGRQLIEAVNDMCGAPREETKA